MKKAELYFTVQLFDGFFSRGGHNTDFLDLY